MTVAESKQSIAASDGASIMVHQWKGSGPVRGIVQIAHGMGEHSLRYRPIAHALVDAGYIVYANDHRGHGELAAQANALGDFGPGGFPALVDDMTVVTRFARDANNGKPLILLGHSMGSFAAQLYLLDHSELLDGAALSGTTALDLLGAAAMSGRWKLEDLNAAFEPAPRDGPGDCADPPRSADVPVRG
jgi:alpha-beta hydrolase superfamily lysophospholipase